MGSRRNNLIILGLVVVLLGVAAYLIFIRQPVAEATKLGLDLEGGVSVLLEGYQTDGSQVTREEMEQAVEVIRQRVDSLGVTEPEIQIQGQDQVAVNIPGITDADRAVEVIGRTAQLGFYEVLAFEEEISVPQDEIEQTKNELADDLRGDDVYQEGKTKILFEESPSPAGEGTYVAGYVVNDQPDMTGENLENANLNRDPQGRLEVTMSFNREGAGQFADLSGRIAENALASGQPGTGALPVNMRVLSVTTIGPTLGTESLRSGLIASLVGLGLVLLFLLAVYRVLGVVADLALLIFAFLLWGLVVAIPVTVTLPGIAGIVLSIGVAADANIVIFERIKEEIRRGKTPRTAVQTGYQKGFRAILDGNVTTLITAFILFALSSGSVRGFAVLLSMGVVLSMFTAIVVTRALLGLLSDRGIHLSPALMGVSKASISATQEARVK